MALINWLTLIEMVIGCTLYSASLIIITRILYRIYNAKKTKKWSTNVSPSLLIYFTSWAIQIPTGLISNLYVLARWHPFQSKDFTNKACQNILNIKCKEEAFCRKFRLIVVLYLADCALNSNVMFWTTIVTSSMSAVIPFSVFFLTVERILNICIPTIYTKQRSYPFAYVTTATIILIFVSNFVAFCMELPLSPQAENCITWSCLFIKTGSVFYTYTKMTGGALNCLAGAFFIYKFWQVHRGIHPIHSNQWATRKANRVALLVICLELFLNFFPQLGASLIYQITGMQIGSMIGPYNLVFASVDIFVSSIVYYNTGPKKLFTTKVQVTFVEKPPLFYGMPKESNKIHPKYIADLDDYVAYNIRCSGVV
ncbi:serpentine type 7TM GPCR chemoreceptor srbc domain-containing protein [Ditylenchus destructor]|uniref:Serpentine type 7TM GPCR chemoreceptor srbc domain-containing protein n=1 Tax=Ditylenchus destructor TaxID=166010 RepID=A0AAD4N6T7_9BILA|nr:serpentine type 7TM GPCR chemoreceptor srbc domain-containing protein [Ditylenchus destructor]